MRTLVGTKSSLVWLVLVVLTLIAWFLGTNHGFNSDNHAPASIAIFVVAVFKLRLVGLYFMELREAPLPLRGLFEGYCVVLMMLLIGMYFLT
jgi:caa(3)-type oxidase subunit IV